MRTAVVTVVHGRHDHLALQLAGLAAQTRPADRHVVVAMGDDEVRAVVGDRATVVELPADLSQETLAKLADTRISGILIDLQPDRGPRRSGPPRKFEGGGAPHKKPRHKG